MAEPSKELTTPDGAELVRVARCENGSLRLTFLSGPLARIAGTRELKIGDDKEAGVWVGGYHLIIEDHPTHLACSWGVPEVSSLPRPT